MDEYGRILSNPGNFIVSEDLLSRVEGISELSRIQAELVLDDSSYLCNLVFYSRTKDGVRLFLDINQVNFSQIVLSEKISCIICAETFNFGRYFEYDNSGPNSILILDTLSTREEHVAGIL